MKICNICKLEKGLECYSKRNRSKDGLQHYCKACDAKSSAKYRQEHKEKIARYGAKYYLENKEKRNKQCAKWWQENKEKMAEYRAKYQKDHPEVGRAKSRKRRAMKQEIKENYTKDDEEFTRTLFNNECFNCGCKENLVIDHHKPLSKGFPLTRDNAVVLCKSCNSSKGTKSPEEFYLFPNLNLLNSILTRQ